MNGGGGVDNGGGGKKKAVLDPGALDRRRQLRDAFFREVLDPMGLLQPLENLPGLLYFVKDRESRLMAISSGSLERMGFEVAEEVIGLTVRDYLPADMAEKYLESDEAVMGHGKPLRNLVELWLNEQGVRDWIVTDKYPLRGRSGQVVGLIGVVQSFAVRRKMSANLGPVGKAADYIREHLGKPLMLSEIAKHAGFSERQLQRLFRTVFGLSIQQFIIQSRIHAAIHELTLSNRSIAEISDMFGFSDQSAFTNQFRKLTGMPPKAYRDRYAPKLSAVGHVASDAVVQVPGHPG